MAGVTVISGLPGASARNPIAAPCITNDPENAGHRRPVSRILTFIFRIIAECSDSGCK